MTFGDKIIEVRKQREMTQQELGKAIGVDKRVISKYEKNQTVPWVMVASEIAKALDASLDFLISSDKALFIDDKELINLLKNYNNLNDDAKHTAKSILKALNLYSQTEKTLGKRQLIPNINNKSAKKISFDKYSGALSEKEGEEIKKEIQKGREEWDRRITY